MFAYYLVACKNLGLAARAGWESARQRLLAWGHSWTRPEDALLGPIGDPNGVHENSPG